MFVSLRRTQTWRLHAKLYEFGWHISANNARMKNSRGLILGEAVYISVIYPRFLTSFIEWLRFLVLITWLVKTENKCEKTKPQIPALSGFGFKWSRVCWVLFRHCDWLSTQWTVLKYNMSRASWIFTVARRRPFPIQDHLRYNLGIISGTIWR